MQIEHRRISLISLLRIKEENRMKEFTFGIISYNQEDYILELLESIRYQIENYGKGINIYLIIADDASTDNTRKIEEAWVRENFTLFEKTVILDGRKNVGVVENYKKLLNAIKTDCFKTMAGDDVFADHNIFEFYEKCGDHNLTISVPVILCDNRAILREDWYYNHFYYKKKKRSRKYDIERQEMGSYFQSTSVFYHMNQQIEFFREPDISLKLFDDDCRWHSILVNDKDSHIVLEDDYLVLYRMHDGSICQTDNNPLAAVLRKELVTYKKYIISRGTSLKTKIILHLQLKKPKNKYLYILNYTAKFKILYAKFAVKALPYYKNRYNIYVKQLEKTNSYVQGIHQKAIHLKKEYINE